MISYITEVSLYWVLGYVLYLAIFKRWTLFQWNRIYLLAVLFGGALLPFLTLPFIESGMNGNQYLPEVIVTLSNEISSLDRQIATQSSPAWMGILPWIYTAGVLFFFGRTVYALHAIRGLFKSGIRKDKADYTLVRTNEEHPPFAFGQWIFINHKVDLSARMHRIILDHEKSHVRAGHTIDVLLTEIMGWIFWFHPLVYLYRYSLRLNHEFSADADVLTKFSKISYGRALIEFHRYQPEWHLTRSFHFSKLKKRFIMMDTKSTNRNKRWGYLAIIPIFLIAFFLFESNDLKATWIEDETIDKSAVIQDTMPVDKEVYKVAEVMPLFPGCDDIEDREKRRKCSNSKMLKYIYGKVEYPEEARKNKLEGTVAVRFVVGSDGHVRDIEIANEANKTLGDAALKAVRAMQSDNIQWTPGRQSGEDVAVGFTLPIRFKLPDKDHSSTGEKDHSLIQSISPNPSDGTIEITLSGSDHPADLSIKDNEGRFIRREKIRTLAPEQSLQFSFETKGTYWLQVTQGEESNMRKFIIQ